MFLFNSNLAIEAIKVESIPDDKNSPIGTSETNRDSIDLIISSLSSFFV